MKRDERMRVWSNCFQLVPFNTKEYMDVEGMYDVYGTYTLSIKKVFLELTQTYPSNQTVNRKNYIEYNWEPPPF